MPIIYEPAGAAREYAALAANLYRGCGHGCLYCYAPACLRMSKEKFHGNPQPRVGVLDALERDARRLAPDQTDLFTAESAEDAEKGHDGDAVTSPSTSSPPSSALSASSAVKDVPPILLCFTTDPYQPIEEEHKITRQALKILLPRGFRVRILTKNPGLAIRRDIDILAPYRGQIEFGTTLLFNWKPDREHWEPNAAPIRERIQALMDAHDACIPTWISIEPVIDPNQALLVLDYPHIDTFKVGKLNHDKKREKEIDWTRFLRSVLGRLEGRRAGYYIKNDLWAYADEEIREKHPKARPPRRH